MKFGVGILATVGLFTAFIGIPLDHHGLTARLHAQAQAPDPHHPETATAGAQAAAPEPQRQEMMAAMKAADAKLDDLVQKMNAATGEKKTEAMAALLTALVQEHRIMSDSMMANMMKMMDMMGSMGRHGADAQGTPK